MAFTKQQALDTVVSVLSHQRPSELSRLERIHDALNPRVEPGSFRPSVEIPVDAPPLMVELARKSESNYLPLLVKTFSQVMKVDGYISESDPEMPAPWSVWQKNRMDSRQTGLTRSALAYGAGYATALPGVDSRGRPGAAISLYSPRQMTALYQDVEADEWPMLAISVDEHPDGSALVSLFDDDLVYRFGMDKGPSVQPLAGWPAFSIAWGAGRLTYIDQLEHDQGVVPVVRYRDRNLLAGEEQFGIVEPLMTIQERINETTFQMMVAQYFQAFKQRYIIGWASQDETEALKASAARIWEFEDDDVKVGQLDGAPISPYVESRLTAIRDFSAIGQIPAQALGVDGISNISDATLAGLEAAKNREGGEIMTSLGESHEQLLRLCARIDGNEPAADDYASEVRWRNFEARSFAQTVDGLVKLAQGLSIPGSELLEDVPGFSGQRIDRVRTAMRSAAARSTVDALSVAAGRGV